MLAEKSRSSAVAVVAALAFAVASPAPKTSTTAVSLEALEPQEHVLEDGSRTGSLVYVDSHGDLVQVRYLAGPAAGPRGFRLEELPVHVTAKDAVEDAEEDPQEAQGSAPALQVIPPPREVRRAPTPRPSDAFWQPKENSDVARKERSEMRRPRPPPTRFGRVRGVYRPQRPGPGA